MQNMGICVYYMIKSMLLNNFFLSLKAIVRIIKGLECLLFIRIGDMIIKSEGYEKDKGIRDVDRGRLKI